ncbi:YraN family protein [Rhizobium helianthi]|uniref:UPF0102 protein ACFSE1_04435 n=1 Tax=Rhizobium helianthi TaxID=1132695 RepID=A0ABW4M0T8_9HYPH
MKARFRNRKHAERRGRWSEYWAALFLMAKGYRILNLRYKTRSGEIDLVARKGSLVIFVEVKARQHLQGALDAVSFRSQNRIRAASDHWMSRRKDAATLSQRYDIIAVLPWRFPRHFVDAF